MKTQADDLNSEKQNLISMMSKIEKIGDKDSDIYKYFENRYYNVVSTLNNIR